MSKVILLIIISLFAVEGTHSQEIREAAEIGNFKEAADFAISSLGVIYISDLNANEIIAMDTLGKETGRIGGYGWNNSALSEPVCLTISGLNVIVTDRTNKSVKLFDKNLNFISEIKSADEIYFDDPVAAAANSKGDIYILDRGEKKIIKMNSVGGSVSEFGGYGDGEFSLNNPSSLRLCRYNLVYCLDGEKIKVFDEFGNGIKILSQEAGYSSINTSEDFVTLTSSSDVLVFANPDTSPFSIMLNSCEIDVNAVSSLIYQGKFYVLTKTSIKIFENWR